jgi:hypothetical protein
VPEKSQTPSSNRTLASLVATVRPHRGNVVAEYDGSSVKILKPLRRQLRTIYDSNLGRNKYAQKKVGNNQLPQQAIMPNRLKL